MNLTQKKVNKICEYLINKGDEISIEKVYKLLPGNNSFVKIAHKVLLFKHNRLNAIKIAKKELLNETQIKHDLNKVISQALFENNIPHHEFITYNIKEKIQKFFNNKINKDIQYYQKKIKKILQHNEYLEIKLFQMNNRILKLIEEKKKLNYYNIRLNNTLTIEYRKCHTKKIEKRDFKAQILSIQHNCCAVYDLKKNIIVVKIPHNHKVEKEFKMGRKSLLLKANAIYDFKMKYWFLDNFVIKTFEFLEKNNLIFSQELTEIFKKLKKVNN